MPAPRDALVAVRGRLPPATLDLAAGAALALFGVATATAIGAELFHSFVGDSTIYLPYARNIAHGDFFSYNPHQFSSGSTGPLWAVVLAIPYLVGAAVSGAKAVAVAVAILALLATVYAAWRAAASLATASLGALFVLGTMPYYASLLFESGLVLLFSAVSISACARVSRATLENPRTAARALLPLALTWAALPLLRPDAAALVALQAVVLALFWPAARRRRLVALGVTIAVAALPALLYYGYSLVTLRAYSVSAVARSFALSEQHSLLGHVVGIAYSRPAYNYIVDNLTLTALAIIGLALALRRRELRWLGAYGIAALLSYAVLLIVVQPVTTNVDRYFVPVLPIVATGVAYALREALDAAGRGKVRAAAGITIGMAATLLVRPSAGARGLLLDAGVLGVAAAALVLRNPRARVAAVTLPLLLLLGRYLQGTRAVIAAVPRWADWCAGIVLGATLALIVIRAHDRRALAAAAMIGTVTIVITVLASTINAARVRADRVGMLPYGLSTIVEQDLASRVNRLAPHRASILLYEAQDRYALRSDIELLSLDGVTDGKVIPYLHDHRLDEFLRRYRPALWAASDSVETRPFLRASILRPVYERLLTGATTARAAGIRFRVLARRDTPLPPGFSGWRLLVGVRYVPAGRAK